MLGVHMIVFLYMVAALCGYLIGGLNPAVLLSNAIYHRDIRECGSGNPGFTNFKRTFGNKWAWWVLLLDLSKGAIAVGAFGALFAWLAGDFALGAAFTGLFTVLGHVFPVQYRFKGGKGFLVALSTVWVVDWRVGLFATLLMIVLLLTTKYMSLATVTAMLCTPVLLYFGGASIPVVCLVVAFVLLMTVRHKQNFKRLWQGTESKFSLAGKHK